MLTNEWKIITFFDVDHNSIFAGVVGFYAGEFMVESLVIEYSLPRSV